ncbi:Filamin-B [Manis pentadactyla]|nr:Filamin-B [Manis pentadactyla]
MREGPGERWGEAAHSELSDDGRQNAVLVGGNASTTTACKTPTERPVKLLPSVKCEPLGSTGVHLGSVDLVEKAPRNCQIHAEDEPQAIMTKSQIQEPLVQSKRQQALESSGVLLRHRRLGSAQKLLIRCVKGEPLPLGLTASENKNTKTEMSGQTKPLQNGPKLLKLGTVALGNRFCIHDKVPDFTVGAKASGSGQATLDSGLKCGTSEVAKVMDPVGLCLVKLLVKAVITFGNK